jgi:hypothetical protein
MSTIKFGVAVIGLSIALSTAVYAAKSGSGGGGHGGGGAHAAAGGG